MKKKCPKCNKLKNSNNYYKNKCSVDGLQTWCKTCMKKNDYSRYWNVSGKDKQRRINNNKERKRKNNIFICTFLNTHPCIDCGEKDIKVLTFDHIKGKKKDNIASLMSYSIKIIKKEINKCVVRCYNCHVKKTRKTLHWKNRI
jgi:hypothetical protein